MTRKDISEAMGCISSRHVEELSAYITESEAASMNNRRSNIIKIIAIAACFAICLFAGYSIGKGTLNDNPPHLSDNDSISGDGGQSSIAQSLSKAKPTGKGFSPEEIESYIKENGQSILQIVMAEYSFDIKSVWINKVGYSHASCDNGNKVNLDYITLPILVNGEIYAEAVLVKTSEGDIIETINIGGDTWKSYNSALLSNPETEIVFAFLPEGIGQIMIMPDNTGINPVDGKLQSPIASLNPDIDWYSLLKTEYNTISGNEILNPENNTVLL